MPFSSLLQSLEQETRRAEARFEAISTPAVEAFGALAKSVAIEAARLEDVSALREEAAADAVNWEIIREACAQTDLSRLSRAHLRAIVANDGELSPDAVRFVLQSVPSLRPKYRRRLFSQWGSFKKGAEWDAYVQALEACSLPENSKVASSWTTRLRWDGPARLAHEHPVDISELARALESAGVREANPYWCRCALHWFIRSRRERKDLGRALRWVMSNAAVKKALTPQPMSDAASTGRTDLKGVFVAIILAALKGGLVREEEAEELERVISSSNSEFGDPRIEASLGWATVKEAEPEGFSFFLSRLVEEDLQFFFDRAMRAKERRDFWLQYVPSIRRTKVILDADNRRRIERTVPNLSERLQAAFRRTERFASGDTSAFCMWFDSIVVVEFSQTGNAAYVYERQSFEERLGRNQMRPNSVSDLKKPFGKAWRHFRGWESEFEGDLRRMGIRPGRPFRSL